MGDTNYSRRENNLVKFVVECIQLTEGLELALEGDARCKKVLPEVKKYEDVVRKTRSLYNTLKKRSKNYKGPQIDELVAQLDNRYEKVKERRKEKIDWQ